MALFNFLTSWAEIKTVYTDNKLLFWVIIVSVVMLFVLYSVISKYKLERQSNGFQVRKRG